MTPKNRYFMLRLTEGELIALDALAQSDARTKSDYLRHQIFLRAGEAINSKIFRTIIFDFIKTHTKIGSSEIKATAAEIEQLNAKTREAFSSGKENEFLLLQREASAEMDKLLRKI